MTTAHLSDDMTTLYLGNATVDVSHLPGWKRLTLWEAINRESDAAENDADTAAAERADAAHTDGYAAALQDVKDLLAKHIRRAAQTGNVTYEDALIAIKAELPA